MDARIPPDQISVAIGGVGGSGTRLIADMLMRCEYYIGGSLNRAHDNLWFTLLFKRPGWFKQLPSEKEIASTINLFVRAMTTGLSENTSESETNYIWKIARELEDVGFRTGVDRTTAKQLVNSRSANFNYYAGWGWKEPNTHIFLPQIAATIPTMKYVHVIRNGLDMAAGNNQQQLHNWGKFIGVPAENSMSLASRSLEFWIAANRRAIDICERQFHERYHIINYDEFCKNPYEGVERFAEFLGVTMPDKKMEALAQLVSPKTIGRRRRHTTGMFSETQVEAVREFGFVIDEY